MHIMRTVLIFKSLFAVLLISTSVRMYQSEAGWFFMNNVNLIFHEAGHVLTIFFGHFIYVLGGTIGELAIPSIVTVYFLLKRKLYSAGFGLWWLSTALWSVSVYARDARAQQLPLITGNTDHHDWTYLLGELGLLRHDQLVGDIFLGVSVGVFMLALFLWFKSFMLAYEKDRQVRET